MKRLGLYVPVRTRFDLFATGGMAAATLAPHLGLVPAGLRRLDSIGLLPNLSAHAQFIDYTCGGIALGLTPFLVGKGLELFSEQAAAVINGTAPVIDLCGMPCRENALFTGVYVSGSTGSGKTSSAVLPFLDQVFHAYNHDTEDAEDVRQNIGGFSLDAKMEFFEPIMYFMDDAGRNVLRDVVVLRPHCLIPVGVFEDPDTGLRWMISGQSYSTGSEIKRLLDSNPEAAAAGVSIDFLSKKPVERRAEESKLRDIVFDVAGRDIHLLGWRRRGDSMVRLAAIRGIDDFDLDDTCIVAAPKRLRYLEYSGVDSGIRYNVVDNRVSAAVAGQRLANIAALIDGGEGSKKDPYWDKQAASLFTQVLDSWYLLETGRDIGGPDILRLIEQRDRQEELIAKLKAKRDDFAKTALTQQSRNRALAREAKGAHQRVDDLIKYFDDTWKHLAPNTKSIIESCVRNMFGQFVADDKLAESFCSPATIALSEMITHGRFFCFVAGQEYAPLAKMLGTAIKMDAHSNILARVARADWNKTRRLLEAIDECQDYAVAGASGDPDTKNKSRASYLIHINATQSDASIEETVGRNRVRTYMQAYGVRVWYQQQDHDSRKTAAEFSGQVFRETKEIQSGSLTLDHIVGGKSAKSHENTRYQKEARWGEHVFLELDTHESVIFNKDRRVLVKENKRHRQANIPHAIGGPSLKPALAAFLRKHGNCIAEYSAQNTTFNPEGMNLFRQAPVHAQSTTSAPLDAKAVPNPNLGLDGKRAPKLPPTTPSEPIPDPSPELLARLSGVGSAPEKKSKRPSAKAARVAADAAQPQEAPQQDPAPVTTPAAEVMSSEDKLLAALARYERGECGPSDLALLQEWQSKPENQAALAEYYIEQANVGTFVQTQSMATMTEEGGETQAHRGPNGAGAGIPKGQGSIPKRTESPLPPLDSLDLSNAARSTAAKVAKATQGSAASSSSVPGSISMEQLKKQLGNLG